MSHPLKIGIYSPYLDTAGGGERYMLTIAEVLSKDQKVDVLLDKHLWSMNADQLKESLSGHLNLDLSKANFIQAPLGKDGSGFKRLLFLSDYDFFFYLTDGSIFYSTAKKNILHIQTPLINPEFRSIKNKLKLKSWNLILYNSQFTKEHAQKYWPKKSLVIYPPVDVSAIKPLKKEKIILTVGRFFGYLK